MRRKKKKVESLFQVIFFLFLLKILTNYTIAKYPIRKLRKLASILKNQHEYSRTLENQIEVLNVKGSIKLKIITLFLLIY